MAEYKVARVDDKPREWTGDNGTIYYIKVILVDTATNKPHPKAVEIGKKSADALKVNDIVNGEIIPKDGFSTDSFKAEKPQFKPGGGGGKRQQVDPLTMYTAYAKDVAVAMLESEQGYSKDRFNDILADIKAGGVLLNS